MSGAVHIVEQGESVESIAFQHGHFWQTLWNHPENADLKTLRKDPNVLFPGDRIYVPELRQGSVEVKTGATYRFRRKGVPSKLHLILRMNDRVLANTPYAIEIDGKVLQGESNDKGEVIQPIAPNAKGGRIRVGVGFASVIYDLDLRALDPIDTVSGVQARLRNLGYTIPAVSGEIDSSTRAALARFRKEHGLSGDDAEPDQPLRSALESAYGH